jgi:hypothetical protein
MARIETTEAERAKLAMEMIARDEQALIAAEDRRQRLVRNPNAVVAEMVASIDAKLPTLPVRKAKPGNMTMLEYMQSLKAELINRPTDRVAREIAGVDRRKQSLTASLEQSREVLNAR